MNEARLELYWNEIPIGKENAVTYTDLCPVWGKCEREVRRLLHYLSLYDNGDDYILIRSAANKGGFYRTDNIAEIEAYKKECLNKGRSIFAPVKKINRVLYTDTEQIAIDNNMRVLREAAGLKQSQVCKMMKQYDTSVDKSMLSKFENGICLPTPYQLIKFAFIYGCEPSELIDDYLY